MHPNSRIFIAGHGGRVGRALLSHLTQQGYRHLLTRAHARLDLGDAAQTDAFFEQEKPDYVVMAAAVSMGADDDQAPVATLLGNMAIQASVMTCARRHGVKRLILVVPPTIYPRQSAGPIAENAWLTGPTDHQGRARTMANIAAIELAWSFNRQYGTRYLAAVCAQTFGADDPQPVNEPGAPAHGPMTHGPTAHGPMPHESLPRMMAAFHAARRDQAAQVVLAGSGAQTREWLYSRDLADGLTSLLDLPDAEFDRMLAGIDGATARPRAPLVNIGSGQPVSTAELARAVRQAVGYDGVVTFERHLAEDAADGPVLDNSLIRSLGWAPRNTLAQGLKATYTELLRREAFSAR